jgi:hypothetical protein
VGGIRKVGRRERGTDRRNGGGRGGQETRAGDHERPGNGTAAGPLHRTLWLRWGQGPWQSRIGKGVEVRRSPDYPPCGKHFQNEKGDLQYAIHNQRNRRNMTEADLLKCIELVDRRQEVKKNEQGKFTGAPNGAPGKSVEVTAKIVGTCRPKSSAPAVSSQTRRKGCESWTTSGGPRRPGGWKLEPIPYSAGDSKATIPTSKINSGCRLEIGLEF